MCMCVCMFYMCIFTIFYFRNTYFCFCVITLHMGKIEIYLHLANVFYLCFAMYFKIEVEIVTETLIICTNITQRLVKLNTIFNFGLIIKLTTYPALTYVREDALSCFFILCSVSKVLSDINS